MLLTKRIYILLILLSGLFATQAYCKVKVYPIPFVPYGSDAKQGAYGTDEDIVKNTNPQYQTNRNNGLIFDQLPGEGTITLYTVSGQEAHIENYNTAKKNFFIYDNRANMLPSGIYIWVVRPSTGEGIEKGKLIILK